MTVETWDAVHESLQEDMMRLKDGDFVAVEYGHEVEGGISPYAQVARVGNHYWCEIASNTFSPDDSWPLHRDLLRAAGWSPPDGDFPNWSSEWSSASAATTAVIHGLRYGRGCANPGVMEWRTGTSPRQMGLLQRFREFFCRKSRPTAL